MAEEETAPVPAQDEQAPAVVEKTIPYDRFQEVVGERNAAREELAGLRASVTELKAGHTSALDKLQGEVTAAADRASALEATNQWSESLIGLAKDGIHDQEITDYLRFRYDSLEVAEGADKPSFGDWFTEYKATEPAVLAPFTGSKPTAPKAIDGTKPQGAPPQMDADAILSMSREEYQAHREALMKDTKF